MGFFGRLLGSKSSKKAEPPPPAPPGKAWIMGTAEWGGVLLEVGPGAMVLIVLPIDDAAAYAKVPAFPTGMIREIIVCNTNPAGVLQTSAIARAAGLVDVFALDADAPIDRGAATTVRAVQMPAEVRRGPLTLDLCATAVLGTWLDGITVLVGDEISFAMLADLGPQNVIGRVETAAGDGDDMVRTLSSLKHVILMANLPGSEAEDDADLFANLGVTCTVAHAAAKGAARKPASKAAPKTAAPRATQVLAYIMAGDLPAADELAAEAIAAGDDADDMHYQRAMIALMRDDEDAALRELEQIPNMPTATNSRAVLYARRNDPRAREVARLALERLPGDPLAIRMGVIVHALLGDRDGARAVLATHGHHLDADLRAALAGAIDEPPQRGGHVFPEHARILGEAVKPMIDAGQLAQAEPLLRRATGWDPENIELKTELGYVLSQLQRDDDAIVVYDEAIARGGIGELLRYNRGNCKLRRQRFADAATDFRACVELKPDWHEARVNLISALFADGKLAVARGELEQLRATGGPAGHIRSLEQMLAGTL